MKIKNIMFSGFAAAIFAGVCGAASAATTYELTSKSYVDNKFTAEATARSEEDEAIRGEFAAADLALDGKISTEATARATADSQIRTDFATADTEVLAGAKKYTDDEIAELNQSLSGTSTNLGALTTRVTTAEGEIDALQAADTAMAEDIADLVAADTTIRGEFADADAQVLADAKAYADQAEADAISTAAADATAKADAVKDFVDAGKFVSANGILTTKGGYLVISDGEGNVSLNQVAVVNGDGTKDIITGDTLQ